MPRSTPTDRLGFAETLISGTDALISGTAAVMLGSIPEDRLGFTETLISGTVAVTLGLMPKLIPAEELVFIDRLRSAISVTVGSMLKLRPADKLGSTETLISGTVVVMLGGASKLTLAVKMGSIGMLGSATRVRLDSTLKLKSAEWLGSTETLILGTEAGVLDSNPKLTLADRLWPIERLGSIEELRSAVSATLGLRLEAISAGKLGIPGTLRFCAGGVTPG